MMDVKAAARIISYAPKIQQALTCLRSRTFKEQKGGTTRVFVDDRFVTKHPFTQKEHPFSMHPEVFFTYYAYAEQHAGELAVPFATFPCFPLATDKELHIAYHVIIQQRVKEKDLFFTRVSDWVMRSQAKPIRELIDRQIDFQKELLKCGVFMADPNFWNYALADNDSRVVGFDFDWIYCFYPHEIIQGLFGFPDKMLSLGQMIFIGELDKYFQAKGIRLNTHQQQMIISAANYFLQGLRGVWNKKLVENLWMQNPRPVNSPFTAVI